MRKKISVVVLASVVMISLVACGSRFTSSEKAPTWQEQYDLGVRYLSEGN